MVFIKTITIQGFKSYRDQTQIEPFSPRHNVVLGRNGSGKSNFFAAIRFVLSDAYASMTREERAALLHEGVSAAQTLSAFVEIVFDNADGRFPTNGAELVLRRTIGLKKDEYAQDRKSASRADVINLLESAGFSRSNPYYIVPQGRITALTNAKDHERLALLKEVAGTKVYESKRTESIKIMEETDAKRTKITELLDYIEERLTELESEKTELAEFNKADKERRCLEYALHQRELTDVGEALDAVEDERRVDGEMQGRRRKEAATLDVRIAAVESALAESRQSQVTLRLTRAALKGEVEEQVKARTELRCLVTDAEGTRDKNAGVRASLEKELISVDKSVTKAERELISITPRWTAARDAEAQGRGSLEGAQARLDALYAKRGRATQFRNKAERDSWLKSEISALERFVSEQQAQVESLQTSATEAGSQATKADKRVVAARTKMDARRVDAEQLTRELGEKREALAKVAEERKELWREETRVQQNSQHALDELRKAERDLASMMDKDTGSGLRAVEKIKERLGEAGNGVYGPLYRLFEVPDRKYATAVELTAGTSMFHVVVDTDATAQKVLDIMLREKTGRVTFMPLNRLKPKPQTFPAGGDVVPLIDKLDYAAEVDKAMRQVFGRTAVCRDLAVAAAYVRSHGLNTITLDGDKVDRKGALTGGYVDARRSRLDATRAVRTWSTRHSEAAQKLAEVKTRVAQLDANMTTLQGEAGAINERLSKLRKAGEVERDELTFLAREGERLREKQRKDESVRAEVNAELKAHQAKREAYEAELRSPMERRLTADEENMLGRLEQEVESTKTQLLEFKKARSELGSKRDMLEIDLNENLRRRRDELRARLDVMVVGERGEVDSSSDEAVADLDSRQRELKALEASIDELQAKLKTTDDQLDVLAKDLQDKTAELEQAQAQQSDDARGMARQQKHAERYLAKRNMLEARRDEVNRSIRDLGVLPEEAFKATSEKTDRLVKKLHAINESLKKFAHVNKKAFEQYGNFTKQRDALLKRREDLDESADSIRELIEALDQRKDEAIDRTFRQVAQNFEEVFEQLVPNGRGRLIIQRRVDQNPEEDDEENENGGTGVENYTGVSIKVSFNSKVDEGLRIQQLSGGQKSLVALATVFAIQKCDPAPFYLFDEIDANLDAQYRTAVANMIKSLSGTAQFIATTFRPEMLETADKFYGVLFDNQKVSSIRTITRDEAREFVEQEAQAP
ncbi:RecF/RecN/SMC protein [Auriculariales sp. MPI-PUGE-AT-0066]|nr:RecF/RecN/SMC protein [Auriculariales sp. MPI-PUGE-AT-0066]